MDTTWSEKTSNIDSTPYHKQLPNLPEKSESDRAARSVKRKRKKRGNCFDKDWADKKPEILAKIVKDTRRVEKRMVCNMITMC